MRKLFFTLVVLLLGMGLLGSSAWATSYDPTYNPATGAYAIPSSPIVWNHGNLGDALFGELYRAVSAGASFVTFFEIQNTSGNWTAVHVRLRSGRYSIEAIDFPVLLSPYDVFWFQFEAIQSGGVLTGIKVWSNDDTLNHNTINLPKDPVTGDWSIVVNASNVNNVLLNDFKVLYPDTLPNRGNVIVEEMTQGHIEIFGLWSFRRPAQWMSPFAGPNFQPIMGSFYNTGRYVYGNDPANFVVPSDVGAVLSGQVFVGDFTSGQYMGYAMKAIKDFRSTNGAAPTGVAHRDFLLWNSGGGGVPALGAEYVALTQMGAAVPPGVIVYGTYGGDRAYTEPDWATTFGPTWNDGDDWIYSAAGVPRPFWCSFSLDEVDDALVKQTVSSSYFNGGFALTYSMAAVCFPTKYLHSGFAWLPNALALNMGPWPVGLPTAAGSASAIRGALNVAAMVRYINIQGSIWNMNEQGYSDLISPMDNTYFPYEVTLVPIGEESQSYLASFCFLIWAPQNGFLHVAQVGTSQTIPPFVSFPAGWFQFEDFQWNGVLPRNGDIYYFEIKNPINFNGNNFSMLWKLGFGMPPTTYQRPNIIPISVQMMDWEYTNYDHSRMFDPAWSNPLWDQAI